MQDKLALAQKYRPLLFKDVLGQDSIIKVLKNILKNKKFSSPFMFVGIFGGGKTTLARIFARAILCKNLTSDYEPCNECSSCKSFLAGSNIAYTEIDAASNSGVDSIRKIREDANFKALGDHERKVVTIDECHSISRQGNEALLKQLEDNTTNQVYIFCTTAPESMHETVRSRCFEFQLNKNTSEDISNRLTYICDKEQIVYEKEAIDTIASFTSPHVRDAIKSLDYLSNFGEVSKQVVFEHFNLSLDSEYLKILISLKNNPAESMEILYKVILKTDINSIYDGLLNSTIKTIKLTYNINEFKNKEQLDLGKALLDTYKEDLTNILEELLKRNKYADHLTLKSDLILLNKKLNTTFTQTVYTTKKEIPSVIKENNLDIKNQEGKENKEELIDTADLDKTSEIFKRYKSLPPSLALKINKGKKSSSLNSSFSVELRQDIKDYKQNIPKRDVKSYMESKIKGSR